MSNDFVVKWLLSLLVGSIWVIVSTTVAEKISGKLGGLITGLPSTAVITFLFIGLTQGVDAVKTASVTLTLMSGFYSFFFITYLLLSKTNFSKALTGSFTVWFMCALLVAIINPSSLTISVIAWLFLIVLSISWVSKNITIKIKKIPKKIVGSPIWLKSLLSGLIISGVVLISKIAGPSWGGIFATFPSLSVVTLLVTNRSGGLEFTRLIAKNIQISITTTLGLFAVFSYFLFPNLGVMLGTITSYVLLLVISVPLYKLFERLKQ